jgi:hypothetical protein
LAFSKCASVLAEYIRNGDASHPIMENSAATFNIKGNDRFIMLACSNIPRYSLKPVTDHRHKLYFKSFKPTF